MDAVYNVMQCNCAQTFDQIANQCKTMPRHAVSSSMVQLLQQGCIAMSFDFRLDPVPPATWYACKGIYSNVAYVFY